MRRQCSLLPADSAQPVLPPPGTRIVRQNGRQSERVKQLRADRQYELGECGNHLTLKRKYLDGVRLDPA
jgi:hypothetical protein